MTEYELVQLFFQIVDVANGTIANYMTLIFGMLVTSYLAAHRLDRFMATIALLIYSLFCFGLCNELFQINSDFAQLGLRIADVGAVPETSLGWFGPVRVGPDGLKMIPYVMLVISVGSYLGSILFFFRARKANKAKDVGPVETEA
ncbi:MAG: hypothetical protein AAFP97_09320 [Pseudomonadota bacterium]